MLKRAKKEDIKTIKVVGNIDQTAKITDRQLVIKWP
jgi:hypothetical protein